MNPLGQQHLDDQGVLGDPCLLSLLGLQGVLDHLLYPFLHRLRGALELRLVPAGLGNHLDRLSRQVPGVLCPLGLLEGQVLQVDLQGSLNKHPSDLGQRGLLPFQALLVLPYLPAFLVNHYVLLGPEDRRLLVDPSSPQAQAPHFFLVAPVVPLCLLLQSPCPQVTLVLLVTRVGPLALGVLEFPVVLAPHFAPLSPSLVVQGVQSNQDLQVGLRDLLVLVYLLRPCLLSVQLDREARWSLVCPHSLVIHEDPEDQLSQVDQGLQHVLSLL